MSCMNQWSLYNITVYTCYIKSTTRGFLHSRDVSQPFLPASAFEHRSPPNRSRHHLPGPKNLSKLKDLRISSPLIYNMGNHHKFSPFFLNRANWHLLTAGAMVKAHLQEIRHRSLAENRELFNGEPLGVSCRGYRPADFLLEATH